MASILQGPKRKSTPSFKIVDVNFFSCISSRMTQDQNKPRTSITLMGEDVDLINQLKPVFEKDTDTRMSNINIVRKALKMALRQLSS